MSDTGQTTTRRARAAQRQVLVDSSLDPDSCLVELAPPAPRDGAGVRDGRRTNAVGATAAALGGLAVACGLALVVAGALPPDRPDPAPATAATSLTALAGGPDALERRARTDVAAALAGGPDALERRAWADARRAQRMQVTTALRAATPESLRRHFGVPTPAVRAGGPDVLERRALDGSS